MKRLVLGEEWATKRMKALRFHLIGLPGRVVSHARKLIIRLGGGAEALATLLDARRSHPGAGAGTGRMSPDRAFPNRKVMSGAVPWDGGDAPCARQASTTRPGCTRSRRDSPCVPPNGGRR